MKCRKYLAAIIVMVMVISLSGCSFLDNALSELKGNLIGNSYEITFYDNYGANNLTVTGDKISISGNPVEESGYDSSGSIITTYSLSSVITITIDGNEIESCGDTAIFAGKGLTPILDFSMDEMIESSSEGLSGLTSINRVLNNYKNMFGKSRIVVIKSQLGVPICAFEGDDVFWEIPDDLPKMTKLMIDGCPLYIHRANYQIIDTSLIK